MRLVGVRGECPVCRRWLEAPRRLRSRADPRPLVEPFRAKWVIDPSAAEVDPPKARAPALPRRRTGHSSRPWYARRRSLMKRSIESARRWTRRWRWLMSLAALGVSLATYVYLRRVRWQPGWQLRENSPLAKILSPDGESTGDSGGGLPLKPREE